DGLAAYAFRTRAAYTSAAPALTAIATPSASTISSFVAPCLIAAAMWILMHPSHWRVTATASAISSLVFALSLMRIVFPGGSRGARMIGYLRFLFPLGMLTDKEAEEIERKRREGVSGGPIVLAWVDRLLAVRKERIRQVSTCASGSTR